MRVGVILIIRVSLTVFVPSHASNKWPQLNAQQTLPIHSMARHSRVSDVLFNDIIHGHLPGLVRILSTRNVNGAHFRL